MKIITIPVENDRYKKNELLHFLRTMEIKKELVEQHGLVENRDFNCYYTRSKEHIEVRFYTESDSVVSLFMLKYS